MSFAQYPSLEGAIVFVTGGASGIGRDMVRAFAAQKSHVGFVDIDEQGGRAWEIALQGIEPDATKAEACFATALEIARKQKAKSWELRAATSMARLLCLQGKRAPAHDILAPIYGWFTEGLDTLDVREAELLLKKLALDQPINPTSSSSTEAF